MIEFTKASGYETYHSSDFVPDACMCTYSGGNFAGEKGNSDNCEHCGCGCSSGPNQNANYSAASNTYRSS